MIVAFPHISVIGVLYTFEVSEVCYDATEIILEISSVILTLHWNKPTCTSVT